ncbi:MAG: STAS domain-containing protein [Spirosomataceae bacterium]|jgi:anti-anti-sigma factor
MEFKVEKNEQYALISLKDTALTQENYEDFEKLVRNLFRIDYTNMIVDFASIESLDGYGVSVIRKAHKICANEMGLFVIVTKNDEIIDQLDAAKIEDLTIMPTIEEAVDAVYLNDLENDFHSEEDDEFGGSEFEGGTEDDY